MPGNFALRRILWMGALCAGLSVHNGQGGENADTGRVAEAMTAGYALARWEGDSLNAGPLFRIGRVEASGLAPQAVARLGLEAWEGKTLSRRNLERMQTAVNGELLNHGYPFGTVSMEMKAPSVGPGDAIAGEQLDISITVEPGEGYALGGMRFQGSRTRPSALERMTLLVPGEVYAEERVAKARERLARSPYFESVEPGRLRRDAGRNLLYPEFVIADAPKNRLAGAMGYNSSETGNNQPWTGFFDLELLDISGTARDLEVHLLAREKLRDLKSTYTEPWLWSLPLGGSLRASLRLEDSVYEETEWGFSIFRELDFTSRLSVDWAAQESREYAVDDSTGALIARASAASKLGLGLSLDARTDAPYGPMGTDFSGILTGVRRSGSRETDHLLQTRLRLRDSRIPGGRWGLQTSGTLAADLPLRTRRERGDLFPLGGAKSLRGFREQEFLTDGYLWLEIEPRFAFSRRQDLFVFWGGAWSNGKGNGKKWNPSLHTGYGLGLHLGGKEWVFAVSFALNPDRQPAEGLLHVSAENRF